jgi:uncharacterized protein
MASSPRPAPRSASRLASSSSAYLRAASEQAIDWHPWGREPFDLARRTGRPVLLDIGASWCHWCHVMDETTYSDLEVARLIAQGFVAVKVDRDEHPEVDRRYQQQVGALTGEGGWPLTGFLTVDGELFLGGTFFPPSDAHGRPGFRRVLQEVSRLWSDEPERVRGNAQGIQEALRRMREAPVGERADLAAFVDSVRLALDASYDPVHAGFGSAPKFPHPSAVEFQLWDAFAAHRTESADRARETLLRMADGGLYDQVGGGFHRYSVDEGWHVPHFEKMAIDNAELLHAYVAGFRRFGEPRFEEVVRGTLGWATSVLADPDGGWGASQDADNAPGDDGGYFTWTRAELRSALDPEELRLVTRFFGVGTDGRMPHDPDRNVLFRMIPLSDAAGGLSLRESPERVLAAALDKLRAVRARRPPPTVDRALYAHINGRFVGAFAKAADALDVPSLRDVARRAADRWLDRGYSVERGVPHRLAADGPAGYGLLDDQVSMATGLLELAVSTSEGKYLEAAAGLLDLVEREFRGEGALYRDLAPALYDGPKVGAAAIDAYPLEDSPHLSANAAAALASVRLGSVVHDEARIDRARALLGEVARRIPGAGLFATGSALAAGLLATPAMSVVVEGRGQEAARLLRVARRSWHPNLAVFAGRPRPPFALAAEFPDPGGPGDARALVCSGTSCGPPVSDPDVLARWIAAGGPVPPA